MVLDFTIELHELKQKSSLLERRHSIASSKQKVLWKSTILFKHYLYLWLDCYCNCFLKAKRKLFFSFFFSLHFTFLYESNQISNEIPKIANCLSMISDENKLPTNCVNDAQNDHQLGSSWFRFTPICCVIRRTKLNCSLVWYGRKLVGGLHLKWPLLGQYVTQWSRFRRLVRSCLKLWSIYVFGETFCKAQFPNEMICKKKTPFNLTNTSVSNFNPSMKDKSPFNVLPHITLYHLLLGIGQTERTSCLFWSRPKAFAPDSSRLVIIIEKPPTHEKANLQAHPSFSAIYRTDAWPNQNKLIIKATEPHRKTGRNPSESERLICGFSAKLPTESSDLRVSMASRLKGKSFAWH